MPKVAACKSQLGSWSGATCGAEEEQVVGIGSWRAVATVAVGVSSEHAAAKARTRARAARAAAADDGR